MKQKQLLITLILLLSATFLMAQQKQAANKLWDDYKHNPAKPAALPQEIPANITIPNLVVKKIAPEYGALKKALLQLASKDGGVIRFNTTSAKTIKFDEVIDVNTSKNSDKTILIEGGNNITFDGSNKSSIFVFRKGIKVIIQNAKFQNAKLDKSEITNKSSARTGGGAIEVSVKGALRVRGCQFINNKIPDFDNILDLNNGAAIRLNSNTTGEIFGCTFTNNIAVTGGAIGATGINKLTVINSTFKGNISNSYHSSKRKGIEGAGAIRVDKTKNTIEIYGSKFIKNASNLKASVIEVFVRPFGGFTPTKNQTMLIIDNCLFDKNKHYAFLNATNPDKTKHNFYGPILFHTPSSVTANMKINNSTFTNNEAATANLRINTNFVISNSKFANTKFLQFKDKNGKVYTKGALAIVNLPSAGEIINCTFYKNEIPSIGNNKKIASDIFFVEDKKGKISISNSIFFRTTENPKIKQVSFPVKGSGNNQFIPGVKMAKFPKVSTGAVNNADPKINAGNIVKMCIGNKSLPQGIGGLNRCGG